MKYKFIIILTLLCINVLASDNSKKLTADQQKRLNTQLAKCIDDSDNETLQEKVEYLLNLGANPNSRVYIGYKSVVPPLELAIDNNRRLEILKLLLNFKADPNFSDEHHPPIFKAIDKGNLAAVILLHYNGAKIDAKGGLLLYAAKNGKDDIVNYLLWVGVDKNYTDYNGATFKEHRLAYAVEHNQLDKIKELLEEGTNPNILANGVVPLRFAFMQNNLKSIKLLLEHGAEPYMRFSPNSAYDKRLVINVVENQQQKEFIENYFKNRQEEIKKVLINILPKELIQNIVCQY